MRPGTGGRLAGGFSDHGPGNARSETVLGGGRT